MSDSTVYRWLAQAARSGIPEIEVAARAMMDYYEGAESPAATMTLTADQVRDLLREYIAHRHGSQAEAARVWGISSVYVSLALSGHKPPNAAMLADLGLERVVLYRKRP